ncbi:hypothetical protein LCGC14_0320440 [marine sediment metagenome]|uniref:Uncharacterized protein n=1 Tax=marine sediment metagenome TaxID=412755 RepID=A0A0F9W6Y5_9ZZZZ
MSNYLQPKTVYHRIRLQLRILPPREQIHVLTTVAASLGMDLVEIWKYRNRASIGAASVADRGGE